MAKSTKKTATQAASDQDVNKNAIKVGLLVVLTLILGLAAGYILFGLPSRMVAEDPDMSDIPIVNVNQLNAEDVIEEVKEKLADKYELLESTEGAVPQLKEGQLSTELASLSPAHKVDGFNFYSDYEGGSSLLITSYPTPPATGDGTAAEANSLATASATNVRSLIMGVYGELGLEKTATRGGNGADLEYEVYSDDNLICTVESTSVQSEASTASCGLLSAYQEAAKKYKPFAEILPEANESTVLSGLRIEDAPTEGYQRATLNYGDINSGGGAAVSLFYKSPTGAWTYFKSTQGSDPSDCSEYNTDDLKKAYSDHDCISGVSTVKVQ